MYNRFVKVVAGILALSRSESQVRGPSLLTEHNDPNAALLMHLDFVHMLLLECWQNACRMNGSQIGCRMCLLMLIRVSLNCRNIVSRKRVCISVGSWPEAAVPRLGVHPLSPLLK